MIRGEGIPLVTGCMVASTPSFGYESIVLKLYVCRPASTLRAKRRRKKKKKKKNIDNPEGEFLCTHCKVVFEFKGHVHL